MADESPWDFDFTDAMLRELHEAWAARRLKLEHPYVLDLIGVLARYHFRGVAHAEVFTENSRGCSFARHIHEPSCSNDYLNH